MEINSSFKGLKTLCNTLYFVYTNQKKNSLHLLHPAHETELSDSLQMTHYNGTHSN